MTRSNQITANPGTKAPRTFVETMGYMPNMAARRIAEKKEANEILIKAMDDHWCKRCQQYNAGCLPGQIILCTMRFLNEMSKGMEKVYG